MADPKEAELEKIRKGFGRVLTPQEEALGVTLTLLDYPPEVVERVTAEFAFQTSPFEVAFFVFVKEGEVTPKEEPMVNWKSGKFRLSRFVSVREAVDKVLSTAWRNEWFFRIMWNPKNATVYLLPGLETGLGELINAKLLYEDGEFEVPEGEKLINLLDRPLANGKMGERDEIAILTLGGFVDRRERAKTSDIPLWARFVDRSGISTLSPGEKEDVRREMCCDMRYYAVSLEDGTTMITDDDGAEADPRFAAVKELVLARFGRTRGEPLEF